MFTNSKTPIMFTNSKTPDNSASETPLRTNELNVSRELEGKIITFNTPISMVSNDETTRATPENISFASETPLRTNESNGPRELEGKIITFDKHLSLITNDETPRATPETISSMNSELLITSTCNNFSDETILLTPMINSPVYEAITTATYNNFSPDNPKVNNTPVKKLMGKKDN